MVKEYNYKRKIYIPKEGNIMSHYVPLEKRSKKEQKAFHAAQRGSWNGVNPVSRKAESKKVYNRSRMKQAERKFRKDERPACFSVFSQAIFN